MVTRATATAVPITAIVTAYQRVDQLLETLRRITACDPAPAEIRVHVDGGQAACADAVRQAFPEVPVILSPSPVGPGGGRNLLLAGAAHALVASFDDDSYPIDDDYFARLVALFAAFPQASVVTAHVYHADEAVGADVKTAEWRADFYGCGCAYRRDHYLAAGGYVPLPTAYGMEEVDLALRLHAGGRRVLQSPWLRVFHDTDRTRHANPEVTAASIANIVLLAYLRYPVGLWAIGVWQLINRVQWLLRNGRRHGVLSGLLRAPSLVIAHRARRAPLGAASLRSYLTLRRRPIAAPWMVGQD